MIALVAFTRAGCTLGRRLTQNLGGTLWTSERLSASMGLPSCGDLQSWTGERFQDSEALIFISATGIAVRAIAPFAKDKFSDPAVVSVDEAGRFAVPLLSGHVGGANDLARRVAALTGGQAAISTATDVNGLFAVDQWARAQNLVLWEREEAKAVSAALLEGKPVAVRSAYPISGTMPRICESRHLHCAHGTGASLCPNAAFDPTGGDPGNRMPAGYGAGTAGGGAGGISGQVRHSRGCGSGAGVH